MKTFKPRTTPNVMACQFLDNTSAAEILEWAGGGEAILAGIDPATGIAEHLHVKTPKGEYSIPKGSWVIRIQDGSFYTMEDDEFQKAFVELNNPTKEN